MANGGQTSQIESRRQVHLPAIVAGLGITLKHLRKLVSGKTKATMQYPEERWDSQLPPWYRGAPALVKDEHGKERCVACQLCEFIVSTPCNHNRARRNPSLGSLGKSREAPQGIRDRHDPLHLLWLVRRSVSRAGHLPQEGIIDYGLHPQRDGK